MPRPTRSFWPPFAAAALSFAAWTPSLSDGFAKDDLSNFLANPAVRGLSQWPRFFYDKTSFTVDPELRNVYRPLASLSYAALAAVFGPTAFFFHLVCVCAHAACAALVLVLARELWGDWAAAFAGTAVFALHPAQAESVSYVSAAIPGTFSLLFSLLALRAHAAGRRAPALAAFAAAALFKESALTLPLALAAWDWTVERLPPSRCARRAAPFFALAVLLAAARSAVLGAATDTGLREGTLAGQAAFAAAGFYTHVRSIAWPYGQRVCYGLEAWPRPVAGALLLVLALGALAYGLKRRAKWAFALAFAAAALGPVSNVIPIATLAADRYLYAPLAAVAWLLAAALAGAPRRALVLAAALSLWLAPRCLEQQAAWRSTFTADLAAAQAEPRDACGPALLAVDYYNWGYLGRARAAVAEGLSRRPPPVLRRFLDKLSAILAASR